jgi:hypothetical protein
MLKHRYVVVDLNAIEEGLSHYIHNDDQVVLPHMIISDLAGIKKDERINKHINCLPDWLRARGNQVWLARDWATLEELESSPDICINDLGWRDEEGSKELRPGKGATPEQWLEYFRNFESSKDRQIVEEGRKAFLYGCEKIGESIKINDPKIISQIKSSKCWRTEIIRLVREPIMGHIYAAFIDPNYHTKEWNAALECYPDKFAIGRISRIMCWYSILQAAGIRNVQTNDFEDSAYAHAASYTGFIATEDSHLRDMIKTVFENVTVISKH